MLYLPFVVDTYLSLSRRTALRAPVAAQTARARVQRRGRGSALDGNLYGGSVFERSLHAFSDTLPDVAFGSQSEPPSRAVTSEIFLPFTPATGAHTLQPSTYSMACFIDSTQNLMHTNLLQHAGTRKLVAKFIDDAVCWRQRKTRDEPEQNQAQLVLVSGSHCRSRLVRCGQCAPHRDTNVGGGE